MRWTDWIPVLALAALPLSLMLMEWTRRWRATPSRAATIEAWRGIAERAGGRFMVDGLGYPMIEIDKEGAAIVLEIERRGGVLALLTTRVCTAYALGSGPAFRWQDAPPIDEALADARVESDGVAIVLRLPGAELDADRLDAAVAYVAEVATPAA